jgi:hypothetical protein
MAADQSSYPQWTDYRKKSGLDPLGMQNSSINLYQRLLPGISNVTLRIRYYGLYAWLASVYAKDHRNTKRKSWRSFLRRAEALYALAAEQRGGESGVAGILWAQKKLPESDGKPISFAENADPDGGDKPYLEQPWGVYGAAYGSQLFEIGVLSDASGHEVPLPSAEIGDRLAAAFAEELGSAADRFYAGVQSGVVTVDGLDQLETVIPSKVGGNSQERQIYEDMLFGRILSRDADIARRDTLLLLLYAAQHTDGALGIGDVRWLFYAGMDNEGKTFSLPNDTLDRQRLRWWVYQANDLLHFCYETLLKFLLDKLGAHPAGITLRTLINQCVSEIMDSAPSWPKTWSEFLHANPPSANAGSDADENSDFSLSEAARPSNGDAAKCTPENAWAALRLLAVLMQRCAPANVLIKEEMGGLDPQGFRSLVTEAQFFSEVQGKTFTQLVAQLLEDRIVKRHLWVAQRKFRYQGDYTFLIESDDGLVRLRSTSGPVFTNPRLGPAIRFLEDLHLVDGGGLTAAGERLVAAA